VDDRELENLIRMALESAELDDLTAPTSHSSACLSMTRLELLAQTGLSPAGPERQHLARCRLCRDRFRAFVASRPLGQRWVQPVRGLGLLRLTAAVAACLVLLLYASHNRTHRPARPQHVPISVCHEPVPASEGAPRIDHFATTSEEPCLVLAVFRAWDEACQCLNWQLYEWDAEGRTLAALEPHEWLEIARNVTGNPPVEQLLVFASSRHAGDLPATTDDAAALLQCLNDVAPPACAEDDVSVYASALRECLPASVTLVPKTFLVD
jgi:hypothetical protein